MSGPSGARTHDLLNAIEARSQLRHGPRFLLETYSGPGGIRTRDLISASDARSQLRYRPLMRMRNFTGQEKCCQGQLFE